MAEDTRKLAPISVSELPKILDSGISDYWVFGSTEEKDGSFTSGRYNLSEFLDTAQKALQLQRRIALTMERTEQIVPIGEPMTIYLAKARNVNKLEVKPNDPNITEWTEIPLGEDTSIDISDTSDLLVRIERVTMDNVSTVYLFAQVKND